MLDSRYLKAIDLSRTKADLERSYTFYFELLGDKIKQYDIQVQDMFNMDEKGFLIGYLTKARRIFTKQALESKRILGPAQDGNRKWITCLATICADGLWLLPGLIFKADSGNIIDTWVQDFDGNTQKCYFASSPTGWTNDNLGMSYLREIFDPATKVKARRNWRLLFVDGHSSHINMNFLDYCTEHKILVACYPPHSTHRLQPLDVACFAPLGIYYSQGLDEFIHKSQGLSSVTKRDFFRLFWPAFLKAFSESNIHSAWRKTGLNPFDPTAVLRSFNRPTSPRPVSQGSSNSSVLSASDWRTIRKLLKEVVSEVYDEHDQGKAQKLSNTLCNITTQNVILKAENQGYKEALYNEKKHRKRGKQLFEELRAQEGGGAVFFSPTKIEAAKTL